MPGEGVVRDTTCTGSSSALSLTAISRSTPAWSKLMAMTCWLRTVCVPPITGRVICET